MTTQQYQSIKDQAYLKIQQRLRVTPTIKEELEKKFTEWFQGLVAQGKAQQAEQQPTEQPQPEGAM